MPAIDRLTQRYPAASRRWVARITFLGDIPVKVASVAIPGHASPPLVRFICQLIAIAIFMALAGSLLSATIWRCQNSLNFSNGISEDSRVLGAVAGFSGMMSADEVAVVVLALEFEVMVIARLLFASARAIFGALLVADARKVSD